MINWLGRHAVSGLLLFCLGASPSAVAEPELNAETTCAAPLRAFQSEVAGAVNLQRDMPALHAQMLQLLKRCQKVVEQQLAELQQDFAELPPTSQCQQGLADLQPFVPLFSEMQQQIDSQKLTTHNERRSALDHFQAITPGLLRTVNGVFLHRYAVCLPEAELRAQTVTP
ncbi:hypothetical protein SAMN05216271_3191 [Halopseudomonas sabulinigri]|uniref:Uncharacterized protein n=1 Tax=Halopseudomonas sabulinigri TaxID=472181 RepID=A0A1H1WDH5_9GAMM|nr:hypothetical protein [Halopseudomonas sabulinigri]SDS95337.1 hypothetical protein SAMN05216271_3191 [Halopseudomonas sabulinigri]